MLDMNDDIPRFSRCGARYCTGNSWGTHDSDSEFLGSAPFLLREGVKNCSKDQHPSLKLGWSLYFTFSLAETLEDDIRF